MMDDVYLSKSSPLSLRATSNSRRKIFSSNLERGKCAAHHNHDWHYGRSHVFIVNNGHNFGSLCPFGLISQKEGNIEFL